MNGGISRSKARAEGTQRRVQHSETNGSMPAREAAKVTLYIRTLYIRPDQVIAIEDIQLRERKRTGSRPDKSALVQEALDLLVEKYRPRR
jgi:hypothetical protein